MLINTANWQATYGVGGSGTLTHVTELSGNYARVTWSTEGTSPGGAGILYNGSSLPDHIESGIPVQFSSRVRCSFAQTIRYAIGWRNSSGGVVGSQSIGSTVALPAGVLVDISHTATPPAGATRCVVSIYGGVGSVNWPVGGMLDITRLMIGAPGEQYSDGDTPNWKWLGTIGASESVGYPYRLESIAGTPEYDKTGPGTSNAVGNAENTISLPSVATDKGFTIYQVVDVLQDAQLNVTLRYGNVLSSGTNDNDGVFMIRVDPGLGSENRTLFGRLAADGALSSLGSNYGSAATGIGANRRPAIGRHVWAFHVNDGWTSAGALNDSIYRATTIGGVTVGGPMPARNVQVYMDDAGRKIIRTLVYQKEHDAETRARIAHWLARAYPGSPNPDKLSDWASVLEPVYFAENVPASVSTVATLAATGLYTIAACQEVSDVVPSPGFWQLSENPNSQARRLLGVSSSGTPMMRQDVLREDSTNQGFTTSTISPLTKHVSVARLRGTGQPMETFFNGTLVTPTYVPTASPFRTLTAAPITFRVGIRDNVLQSPSPTTHAIAVWDSILDDETAKRVTAWMARKYGTPVPAGY